MSCWNYWVRLYRPRTEILSGKWKFPEPQKVIMKPAGGVVAISMDQEIPPIPKPKDTK